jgi:hypothetical protein
VTALNDHSSDEERREYRSWEGDTKAMDRLDEISEESSQTCL